MRYGTITRLSPDAVVDRACATFGPDSELGLPQVSLHEHSITFSHETGFVSVICDPTDDGTRVTVLTREYDREAERFIRTLG